MSKSRPKTVPEMRKEFIDYCHDMIAYWLTQTGDGRDEKGRMEGLVFSIMVALDGNTTALPGFKVIPHPHPDDQQFDIDNGDNWWHDADIAGQLHYHFYDGRRKP